MSAAAVPKPKPAMCAAMSGPTLPGKPHSYMICTRDPGHEGIHMSRDGQGHVLAAWLRMPVERYWRPGDCDPECDPGEHGGGS